MCPSICDEVVTTFQNVTYWYILYFSYWISYITILGVHEI